MRFRKSKRYEDPGKRPWRVDWGLFLLSLFGLGVATALMTEGSSERSAPSAHTTVRGENLEPHFSCIECLPKYIEVCKSLDFFRIGLIRSIDCNYLDRVTVTLGPAWYELSTPQQKDIAEGLWNVLSQTCSPGSLDAAMISFRSPGGRDIGGSSIFGSRIKLNE